MVKNQQYRMMAAEGKNREVPKMPEIPSVPESQSEINPEISTPLKEKSEEAESPSLPQVLPQASQLASKEPALVEIENILAEGLMEVYNRMPQALQGEFKAEGERVASRIRAMLEQAKFKVHEVIKMIRKWLGMIPGVNKFFLEQEAKIKTDRIVGLFGHHKKE